MNKGSVELKIDLSDIVTPKSCSTIIVELIKYLIYTKQQIPYPYERLKYYIKRRKESQKELDTTKNKEGTLVHNILAIERHYKKVEEVFEILESTFKNIEFELTNSDGVEEVVVLFGSTIMSPKEVYRIQVPLLSIGHNEVRHAIQKQKHSVFRHLIESEELHKSLDKQIGLTNMFVLLKLKKGSVSKSGWFFPKDNYKISSRVSNVNVSFDINNSSSCTCLSESDLDFIVFIDSGSSESSLLTSSGVDTACGTDMPDDISLELRRCFFGSDIDYSDNENWYQGKQMLKGFRDYKIDGKPVVNIWHRSQNFSKQP